MTFKSAFKETWSGKPEAVVMLAVILIVLTVHVACADNPCPAPKTRIATPVPQQWVVGQPEVLLDGYIRQINWEETTLTYESAYGYIKVIGPICGNGLPVWAGMHVYELNFHWYVDPNPNTVNSTACYVIDYVLHAPTGDYRP